jgi:hypothetical protein
LYFLEISRKSPIRVSGRISHFTRITNVEIGVIILQKMPLSLRLKFVGNLSNTPAFPLTSQKLCDFVMFEPNSYYVQIHCCSLRIIYLQIGCGYMYSAPILNNSSYGTKFTQVLSKFSAPVPPCCPVLTWRSAKILSVVTRGYVKNYEEGRTSNPFFIGLLCYRMCKMFNTNFIASGVP